MSATQAVPASYSTLTIDRRDEDGCVTLCVQGEIDLVSAALLEQELRDAEASAPPRIVLDLAAVDFIDSSGLHVLLEAQRRAELEAHELALANLSRQAQRMLSITGTDAVLAVE